MHGRLGLRAQVLVAVAAGALVVAFGVTLLLVNTIRLHSSSQATTRSDAYLVSVIDLERLVIDAETGLRGYVITGHPEFLQPTTQARRQLPAATRTLEQSAVRSGLGVARARDLAHAAQSYLTGYVANTEALTRRNPTLARSYASTLAGKQLVDDIRSQTQALETLVSDRERARQLAARSAASRATREAIAVLILLTVFTLLLGAFLGRLVISRDRARRRSEETTDVLRQSLLPSTIPAIPDCELAARLIPAHETDLVGGDFYDVFAVGPGQWVIVVGDVCGKGADAAAVTAMARWTLRSQAMGSATPADALRFLNRAMLTLDLGGRFITAAYLLLTVSGGHIEASLACAGHPPGILVPASGAPSVLPARGTLLGVWPEIRLDTANVRLAHGDGIVLYTDGVSDPGPGPERVPARALGDRPRDATADQLADALQSLAQEPAAGVQRDDIAIVAVRFVDRRRDRQTPAATPSRVPSCAHERA
ncbi:MAG TPA: SpoIIE family protein phosphatase [Solirubrobacteraceae bacterium]|jgi:serine phosphatase RsbU (regulator of sigma subunit)|nr:SpoIIE family protein phosphatase [Solirubrobacteraceae bacterium]